MVRPLHLACARPPCGLKASLGLSLLRKRQFLHSILFFKRKLQHGLLCGLRRGIRCDWYRIACKENKNGTCSLTTCTPRFLFFVKKRLWAFLNPAFTERDARQTTDMPSAFTTPPVKRQFGKIRRFSRTANYKIFFPLNMPRAKRRAFKIVFTAPSPPAVHTAALRRRRGILR